MMTNHTEIITNLAETIILYLDDQKEHLQHLQSLFQSIGYDLEITNSIDKAKKSVSKNSGVSIFICDLRFNNIGSEELGYKILREIRSKNKDVFLVLYTAYDMDIPKKQRDWMENQNIKIYRKGDDDEEFILNLERDFSIFQQIKMEGQSGHDKQQSSKMERDLKYKHLVIAHLKDVTNQDVLVPIPGERNIPVGDLVHEVAQESVIGLKYMSEWLDTMVLIQSIKKKS